MNSGLIINEFKMNYKLTRSELKINYKWIES
jgi:hypothetical protein